MLGLDLISLLPQSVRNTNDALNVWQFGVRKEKNDSSRLIAVMTLPNTNCFTSFEKKNFSIKKINKYLNNTQFKS